MEDSYIGKTQVISGTSIKLTVTEQKDNKLIIDLNDGRFFRSDIEHWDNGFEKLNNLSESYDKFIGEKGKDKQGRNITICEVDRWTFGASMRIKVKYEDGTITNSRYKSFLDGKVIKPVSDNDRSKGAYFKPVSEKTKQQYIGQTSYAKTGELMTIIDYINAKNITVEIDNGLIKKTTYAKFCKGEVYTLENNNNFIDRTGEENMSISSGLMRIIEYRSTADITVLFIDDGTTKKTTYKHFREGSVESDYLKNQRKKEIEYRIGLIEKQRQERFEQRNKLGESIVLSNGMVATITRFVSQSDMDVTIGDEVINVDYTTFKNGMVGWTKENDRKAMIGKVVENNYGTKATIIGFNKKELTFDLKLDNGYKFNRKCFDIEKNEFYTPYDKTFGKVGYLGEKYSPQDHKKIHIMWSGLLERVVIQGAKDKKRYVAYKDCSVCDRWLNFSNFCDDILDMWYDCDEQLDIDKDIKCKGNREYSPEKCLLVPHGINQLFSHWKGGEGVNHQVGVEYVTSGEKKGTWKVKPCGAYAFNGKFRTGVHKNFKSEDDAGEYYRSIKHEYVKKVLKSYEGKIPDYIMNYCLKFEFEMDDYLMNVDKGK